jgi:hypothetical protein
VAELPMLPTRIVRLREDMDPAFARVPEVGPGWFVIGPAAKLEPGAEVIVPRYSKHDEACVTVAEVVAERTVQHQPGSHYGTGAVRYVAVSLVRPPKWRPTVPVARLPARPWGS